MKSTNRKSMSVLLLALVLAITGWFELATAQVRGQELYELLGRNDLTTTTGPRSVNWLPDGTGYYTSDRDAESGKTQFIRHDAASGKKSPLFDAATTGALQRQFAGLTGSAIDGLPFKSFAFVQDGAAITFENAKRYFYFDLKQKALRELKRPEVKPQPVSQDLMRNMAASQLWNGTYSPDYNHFAYVKEYDLYSVDTRTGEEKRLTTGGHENLMHGRPDWVYPEEFGQRDAYWWSPDNRLIAYYQYDESAVHQYPIVHHLPTEAELELQNYPKAGAANPTVKLFIVEVASGKIIEVETRSSSEIYIVKPTWSLDSRELFFQRMNRRQNELELFAADVQTGTARSVLQEKEEAFINLHDDFIQLQDGKHFLWSSERSGKRQLYLYERSGKLVRQLTNSEWPVGSIVSVDEKGRTVFYTAYSPDGLESHFFRVRFDGTGSRRLTPDAGSHRISMAPGSKYFTDSFSSFSQPATMNLHAGDGKMVRNLMRTTTEKLDALQLEAPELVIVKAADGVTDLHGVLYKPAGYDPNIAYPLLVSVYGGPHSKSIRNGYVMDGSLQRLAQLGFMVWAMDNRGLVNRGKKFETETYLKLGQVDLADQTAGVKFITQRPYIDGNRVGVFGGSYGGYMTCLALLKEPEVFHVGFAHAPVTDWRNYDTIYTERYMRTPQENPEGYDLGSALPYAKKFKGKLMITHGMIDNNVHPANTMQLIDALIAADKTFDLMFYPEHRHGIRGDARNHFTRLRNDYFVKHLKPGNGAATD